MWPVMQMHQLPEQQGVQWGPRICDWQNQIDLQEGLRRQGDFNQRLQNQQRRVQLHEDLQ